MEFINRIKGVFSIFTRLFHTSAPEIQPRDILIKLFRELEKRKKYGIEEKAFVPNVYIMYLSPFDYEEISPLLSGIKEQLKNKLNERIRKKGYKLLSTSVNIEIREDAGLLRNQMAVESSFLKEKSSPQQPKSNTPLFHEHDEKNGAIPLFQEHPEEMKKPGRAKESPHGTDNAVNAPYSKDEKQHTKIIDDVGTHIFEEPQTQYFDTARVKLEIIDGEDKGDVIALQEGEYTFGRGKEAHILLKDEEHRISRMHFKLIIRQGKLRIQDMGSKNGTGVNGIEIDEAELAKGDVIAVGKKVLLKVA
jgi:hypothetical protein